MAPIEAGMEKKCKVALTTGVFDIIHPGHIRFLEEAKRLAGRDGRLVVIVARDIIVRKNKGRMPLFKARDRALMVSKLKPVDTVYVGRRGDLEKNIEFFIKKIKPDVIVFGYDQDDVMRKTIKVLERLGLNTKVVKMRKFYNVSSSKIIGKIKGF
ncbi:MAG: adenylyltransferase/cytidyltransferase family protein [Thermoproteota archaeon]